MLFELPLDISTSNPYLITYVTGTGTRPVNASFSNREALLNLQYRTVRKINSEKLSSFLCLQIFYHESSLMNENCELKTQKYS